jgi:hypothetical protein
MGFGGPVWHASICFHGQRSRAWSEFYERALRALRGVGDAEAGEWEEHHISPLSHRLPVLHLRRRLAWPEQVAFDVLKVRDIRGTPEADDRLAPVRHLLPAGYHE